MSAKRAINDILQGSVATYLRCGGLFITKLRKVYYWVCEFFLNRWIFDKVIATACNGVNASATLWGGDAEGIKEQLQREESPFVGRQRRPYRESLPACVKPAELVLNENSCENCDNYASWLQFMSLFELIEASHRAHNAKNVNCRINLSQFGFNPHHTLNIYQHYLVIYR